MGDRPMQRAASATAGTTRVVAWIALLSAGLPSVFAQGPVSLRWTLEPGREVRYTLSQETILGSTPEGGRKVQSRCHQEVDLRWVVGEVADGAAEVTLTIDRIRARESRDGLTNEFTFDTAVDAVPAGDPHDVRMAAMLRAVAGSRTTFRLTPRGEIQDVRLADELATSFRRPEAIGDVGPGSEEAVRNLIVLAAPFLPEGPSGSGTIWTRQVATPMPMLGSLVLDKTYTDRGSRPDRPEVHDVDVETRFSLRPMPGSTIEAKLMEQSGVGSFAFDTRRGLVESGRLEDSLAIRYTAEGRIVDQAATTRIEVKLVGDPTP